MTLEEFKLSYRDVEIIKGESEQKMLFKSLCYLSQKQSSNIIMALELVFSNYNVRIDIIKGVNPKNNEPLNKTAIYLLDVPKRVADALNKKARSLIQQERNEKLLTENKIISLLK